MRRPEFWIVYGMNDVRSRYRRSQLGQLWITLSVAAFVGGVGIFYSAILGIDLAEYLPYFALGYTFWIFIASVVSEGVGVFAAGAGLLQQGEVPFSSLVLQLMVRNLVILGHNIVILPVVFLIFPWPLSWSAFLAVPGFLLTCLSMASLALVVGVLGVRFRDVQQVVVTVMPLLFLVTPILWQVNSEANEALVPLIMWNPFFYWLESIRGPLLGESLPPSFWWIASSLAAVMLLAALTVLARNRRHIPYWL